MAGKKKDGQDQNENQQTAGVLEKKAHFHLPRKEKIARGASRGQDFFNIFPSGNRNRNGLIRYNRNGKE